MRVPQVIILVVVVVSFREAGCNCGLYPDCSLLEWMPWGSCEGPCGGVTIQTRKRSVCVEVSKIIPFTVEHVVSYCNITEPISETKVCPSCPFGIYNITTKTCIQCMSKSYHFPHWFQYLEISTLAVISMTVLMTLGCFCLKCCQLCGCTTQDDDDLEERKRILEYHRSRKSRNDQKPIWLNSNLV
ncbi:uncharacterized protein LOC134255754 [Saccostrea cucullata]|uniref:uncharacterized protein LOC134255754 n=1 Tax=Saccostrea cuccullata TaxID=36930 RepID=UPI002ECFDD27